MKYPLKYLLGIDVHQWDLMSHPQQAGKETRTANLQNAILSTGFTGLRTYSDAGKIKDATNTLFMFNPDGRGYTQDDAIALLKKTNPNIQVLFCYQNMPDNLRAKWEAIGKRSTQYREPNTDPLNLATWNKAASDFKVIASRGGKNPNVPDYPLFVPINFWEQKQVMLKGAGLYDIIEMGNEWDNQYSNVNATTNEMVYDKPAMTGAQYATAWKVCYDAAKSADPNIIVSTTGVMTEDPQMLKDALAYAASKGWGNIFDEYQFHCYPWGWSHGNIASALPPEYNMYPAAKAVVAAAQGRPCIIGEWGYDLHPDSNMGVRPFGGYTGEQVRAYWIARSLCLFNVAGIKRAFYYREFQDYGTTNDTNSTIFETSSLFIKDDQDNITRRLSGDVFKQLGVLMGEFSFDSIVSETDIVRVYKFKSDTKELLIGWTVETVKGVVVNGTNRAEITEVKSNYTFPAGVRYELQPGDTMKQTAFQGGSIELSTKPVFILTGTVTPPEPPIEPPTDKIFLRKGFYYDPGRIYYKHYKDSEGKRWCDYSPDYQWYKKPE
jgi:hypothetical protein